MFENIPNEMKSWQQWVLWKLEDTQSAKPTKIPYSATSGKLAAVDDASTWSSFENCIEVLNKSNGFYSGIGFVLTEQDPFAFIDLDDTKGDKTALERQLKIYNEFQSYAEKSPSGSGLHIIVKGSLPSGRRRSFIEIYSSKRYMTMTGDVYRNDEIRDYNELLNLLHEQMGGSQNQAAYYTGLAEAIETDETIIKRATEAANGQKFFNLFSGNWQEYYQSQSEADFALIDIVAFYSQNRAQIMRIFKSSALGKREKANRTDYVNYMLNKCFDRLLPPVDLDGLRNQLNDAIDKKQVKKEPEIEAKKSKSKIPLPAGLLGELAQFIYSQAPRPVPEIALAGAIGLMAGIVGRAFNISGTGLNQYVLLLAPTGTGKEAIASGIDKLMNSILHAVPASSEFVGPAKISSEQALIKHFNKSSSSFVSIVGEFGIQLKMMASPFAPPHMQGLLSAFLDLFNKSGEGKVLRPTVYSDRDKNTQAVYSPAFSMIGESTPEKFYEALDETMIGSGLLPRFTVIEYHGERPALNKYHTSAQPSFEIVEKLATLCAHSLMLNSQNKASQVLLDDAAKAIFEEFDKFCDAQINTSEREVKRHLWNRAHIKALKLAALVAVGINPYNPVVDLNCANWAIDLIVGDVRNMQGRFDRGDIGSFDNDESKQLKAVARVVGDYVTQPWSMVSKYSSSPAILHNEKIIPFSYISRRLSGVTIFKKDKRGASRAIDIAIKTLVDRGDLQEVSKVTMSKDYNTTARSFMIVTPKTFEV